MPELLDRFDPKGEFQAIGKFRLSSFNRVKWVCRAGLVEIEISLFG